MPSSTYLIAPGSTVISVAEIAVAAVKMVESTILTEPPESGVAFIWDKGNVNGFGIVPCGLLGTAWLSGGGAERQL